MAEIQTPKTFSFLTSLSTIDGRFRGRVENISSYFSEFATNKYRVTIEVNWLLFLSTNKIFRKLTQSEKKILQKIIDSFSEKDARRIWDIDEKINHDVKAIELFLSEKLQKTTLKDLVNFIHFGLTSTDVDNIAFVLSLRDFLQNDLYKKGNSLLLQLVALSKIHASTVMLARTHGVAALPTTAGKELITVATDIKSELQFLQSLPFSAKISGAVGNRNELHAAFPEKDWQKITDNFILSFNLSPQKFSTQIEIHTDKINMFSSLMQLCRIGAKLAQDIWIYNSLGYLSLRDKKGHVGSSVMPHKINPIGAELAQTYFTSSRDTLFSVSNIIGDVRMQRDLRDKYALRKVGEACAEISLAIDALKDTIAQIGFNEERLKRDLDDHWEILSAPVQTILRTQGIKDPYMVLKDATRGMVWNKENYQRFIQTLAISKKTKEQLLNFSPALYVGEAKALAQQGVLDIEKFLRK